MILKGTETGGGWMKLTYQCTWPLNYEHHSSISLRVRIEKQKIVYNEIKTTTKRFGGLKDFAYLCARFSFEGIVV